MSKPFNFFLGGTCSRMDFLGEEGRAAGFPEGELVAWLADTYKNTGKTEFEDYLALNGVGTGNRDHHKYDPRFAKKYTDFEGMVGGYGSDEIRDSVVEFIKSKKLTHVNLIGWSRGGYNAIRIANKLFKECPEVEVNILSFDPVPGSGNRTDDCLTLQSNVKKYVSFLALHEHTMGFQPVYPQRASNNTVTEVRVRTTPGNHSAGVGGLSGTLTEQQLKPLTGMARIVAMQTLIEFGIAEYEDALNALLQLQPIDARITDLSVQSLEYKKLENHTIIYGGYASSNPVKMSNGNTLHYRHLCMGTGPTNWKFMNDIPECSHNLSSDCDRFFEIHADTCSLHRDFNDLKIAARIQIILHRYHQDIRANELQQLRQLSEYIESRHRTRGEDDVLLESVQLVQSRVTLAISQFLQRNASQPKPYESFKMGVDAIEPNALDPEILKQTLFLAAQSGNLDYLHFITNNSWSMTQNLNQSIHIFNDATSLIEAQTAEGQTALMLAAQHGHLAFVHELIHDREGFDAQIFRALIVAMQAKQNAIVEYLLKSFARDFDLFEIEMEEAHAKILLIWSIENAKHEMIAGLLTNHIYLVNSPLNNQGTTPLMLAAYHGNAGLVSDLISRDPKVTISLDYDNFDAYNYAQTSEQHKCAALLQSHHEARLAYDERFRLVNLDEDTDDELDIDNSEDDQNIVVLQPNILHVQDALLIPAPPTTKPFLNARRTGEFVTASFGLSYAGLVGLEALGHINFISAVEPFFVAASFASPVAILALSACAIVTVMLLAEVAYSNSARYQNLAGRRN